MKWVEVKMRELGVLGNANYKITCMLDHAAMVTVQVGVDDDDGMTAADATVMKGLPLLM